MSSWQEGGEIHTGLGVDLPFLPLIARRRIRRRKRDIYMLCEVIEKGDSQGQI